MPSRVRVIIQHTTGVTYTGKRAVMYLWQAAVSPARRTAIKKLPNRLARFKALLQELPPEWTLTLIREKRGTQKRKSLYWDLQQRPQGGKNAAMQAAVNAQMEHAPVGGLAAAIARRGPVDVVPQPRLQVRRRVIHFDDAI